MMIGKVDGIKRLFTSFDVGNSAPESQLSGTNDDFRRC
jgi:hypothetical protein